MYKFVLLTCGYVGTTINLYLEIVQMTMGSFRVKSPQKKQQKNTTISDLDEIWCEGNIS